MLPLSSVSPCARKNPLRKAVLRLRRLPVSSRSPRSFPDRRPPKRSPLARSVPPAIHTDNHSRIPVLTHQHQFLSVLCHCVDRHALRAHTVGLVFDIVFTFRDAKIIETAFRPVPGHQCDTGSKTDYPSVFRFPDSVFCHFLLRPCFPCPIYTPCLSVPIVLCHPRSHSASSAAGAGSCDGTTVGSPPTVPLPAPDSSCHPPTPRLRSPDTIRSSLPFVVLKPDPRHNRFSRSWYLTP